MTSWNDMMPGMKSPAAQSSGQDMGSVIDNILSQNSGELTKLAEKAATPIAGGHASSIPLSMDPTPKEAGMAPLDHREVVGAGNAKAQGIGNTITGALNVISQVSTAMDNKKKVEIASSTQQLLTAQQAMDQAQQVLQSDPNNKDAQERVKHNQEIMGTILTGKHGKDIMKGFNIDYTNPSSNKTLQHDAVAMGKARTEAADAFNKGTPKTMAPDTQAQAKYAAAVQEQKYKVEMARAMVPLISAQMREGGAMTREQMRENAAVALQQIKTSDAMDRLDHELAGRKDLQDNAYLHKLSEQTHQANLEVQAFSEKLKIKDADPTELMKNFTAFDQKSTATMATLSKDIADTMQKKIVLAQTGADAGSQQTLDYAINQQKDALAKYQAAVKSTKDYYSLQLTGKKYDDGESSSNTDSSATPQLGSAATWDQPTDDSDEEDQFNPTAY